MSTAVKKKQTKVIELDSNLNSLFPPPSTEELVLDSDEAPTLGNASDNSAEATAITNLDHLEENLRNLKSQKTQAQFSLLKSVPEKSPEPENFVIVEEAAAKKEAIELNDQNTVASNEVATSHDPDNMANQFEKTVAVTGFQRRAPEESDYEDRVKVVVGRDSDPVFRRGSEPAGSVDAHLGQAENLRFAQDKITKLEFENEMLRAQNEELLAASEIIKERSDILIAELSGYKSDREGLEQSYKNEILLLKNHIARKESELQKSLIKTEELESRLRFDMKKIRVRERELENRLEIIRAEKNTLIKSKDEQILDLRRKMDVLQLEVDSYRQKCIELNKQLEVNQDSFKRTTRALRLAMANLELQEENKNSGKKSDS